jgi:hypothetical protein
VQSTGRTEQHDDNEQTVYWNEDGGQRLVAASKIETMLAPLSDHLLTRAAAPRGARVLDVGCGSGVPAPRSPPPSDSTAARCRRSAVILGSHAAGTAGC